MTKQFKVTAKFSNVGGHTCSYCTKPIRTVESLRVCTPDGEKWYHTGHDLRKIKKQIKTTQIKKISKAKNKSRIFACVIILTITYATIVPIVLHFKG